MAELIPDTGRIGTRTDKPRLDGAWGQSRPRCTARTGGTGRRLPTRVAALDCVTAADPQSAAVGVAAVRDVFEQVELRDDSRGLFPAQRK